MFGGVKGAGGPDISFDLGIVGRLRARASRGRHLCVCREMRDSLRKMLN